MNKQYEIEWCFHKLKRKFYIICCVHESDNTLKTKDTDKLKHWKQVDLISDITRHDDTKDVIEWYSSNDIDNEHTFKVFYLDISDCAYFFTCLRVLVSCPEIQNDINQKQEINEEIHIVDEAGDALILRQKRLFKRQVDTIINSTNHDHVVPPLTIGIWLFQYPLLPKIHQLVVFIFELSQSGRSEVW